MTTFSVILAVHIFFGTLALLSGVVTLSLKKGSTWHRKIGVGFVVCMMAMGVTGIVLALMDLSFLFIVIGVFAMYLAATGWRAATRSTSGVGAFEQWALAVVLLTTLASAALGVFGLAKGTNVAGSPSVLYLSFAFYGVLFTVLDVRARRRGGLSGAERLADHLWRVIMGLIFATTALFVANAEVLPAAMQKPYFTWGPIALLYGVLVYWLVRVLRGKTPSFTPK